mmetsp:Transcript_41568/g.89248  ORF Transcript_41568/g.89248 Transcript_41568/m.89248 type:complete len:480 (-) Transcript_41568:14-1453(-)
MNAPLPTRTKDLEDDLLNTDDSDDDDESSIAGASSDDEASSLHARLTAIERHDYWNWFVIGVILLNTMVLAIEADYPGEWWAEGVDNLFLAIFVVELLLRLSVYGWDFFSNKDYAWNWFDFIIVFLGVIDQWVISAVTGVTNPTMANVVSTLRVIRVVRVLRAFKIFKHFKPLRLLGIGLVSSLSSVFWIAMMFVSLVFTSAIFVTNMVGHNADSFGEDKEDILHWFGTMPRSMETLSIYLTCDDWSTSARAVNNLYPWMEVFWIWYMVMGAFLVLSLLTGLMADKMKEARDSDDQEQKTKPDALAMCLEKLKQNGGVKSVHIDEQQFREIVQNDEVSKGLSDAGLKDIKDDPNQQLWLFKAIDRDNNNVLSWDEVFDAFTQISKHGESSSNSVLEIMRMEGVLMKLDRRLRTSSANKLTASGLPEPPKFDRKLEEVHARSSLLKARIKALDSELLQFFKATGFTPRSPESPTSPIRSR